MRARSRESPCRNAGHAPARVTAALALADSVHPGQLVTVPRGALVIRQNRSYVLRVTRADTFEELDVTPGAGVADAVEVRGALAAGDRLVIRGGERLVAGQAVRVIDAAQHASQPHAG